ncbi:choice-of-anchor B family protein [Ulvibacter antarcticus]|uniref:Choice-of-anchor B domain-containing protein n=1 Tax=Ulvibacter antarcticus TaxID=442714 RepID=A0A3L9YHQ4_9FLAO|nr:choice-of-anchor B family protein [Ulvibacter antarcticus]RMA57665.1 choice-of-anchor B domain-containing protein [Ulvibacter antarcticus]
MKKILFSLLILPLFSAIAQPCSGGKINNPGNQNDYPCNGIDLVKYISASAMGADEAQDSWGWTDVDGNGDEYAIVALDNGTAFVNISASGGPVYLGRLNSHSGGSNLWRDVKVYNNHAYIVSEVTNDGLQIFDLTNLRGLTGSPVATFSEDGFLSFGDGGSQNNRAHNIVINEDSGYGYVVGVNRASNNNGGPIFVKLFPDPKNPTIVGEYGSSDYFHDAQVVIYDGPDTRYHGREIMIGANEDEVVIVDVTDKNNPVNLSTISYTNVHYTHQGWFTFDKRFFILGDEVDEENIGGGTRTFIFDFNDLEDPKLHFTHTSSTVGAIDHNGYVKGNRFYLANYSAGMRMFDITSIYNSSASASMSEIKYFDTFVPNNSAAFHGTWNVYPYFKSGNIVISGFGNANTNGDGGVFIVKDPNYDAVNPVAIAQNISVSLGVDGTVKITPDQIDNGSTDNVVVWAKRLDQDTFTCADVGTNVVTLSIYDGNENVSTTTAIVTVVAETTTFSAFWSNGQPDAGKNVVFNANYKTSDLGKSSIEACSCEIKNNAIVTVDSGEYMKVGGNVIVDAGSQLIVEHQANFVQENDDAIVTNNGSINVKLTTPAMNARDFLLLGSPMTSDGISAFADGLPAYQVLNHTTANFQPYSGTPPIVGVNFYDQEQNDWTNFSGTLAPSEGYLVRPSYTQNGTYNYEYNQGTLNSGEITYAAGYNTSKESSANVLSNPYASAIDAAMLIENNAILDEVYFWEHNTTPGTGIPGPQSENFNMEDISTYNGTMGIPSATGGTTPNGIISTGQGFGIKANAAGDVTFNNAIRLTSGNTTLRKTTEKDLIWLTVREGQYHMGSTAGIGFLESATADLDQGFDTEKLGTVVSLYSHLDDGSQHLGIQGREAFDAGMRIPMGFSTLIDVDGGLAYVISISDLRGVNLEAVSVFLEDHVANTVTNLSNANYEFTSEAGTYNNRFTLRFQTLLSGDTDSVVDSLVVFPNPTTGIVNIQSPDSTLEKVTIYDAQGRILLEKVIKATNTNFNKQQNQANDFDEINISGFNPAVYFMSLQTSNGTVNRQIIKE